MRETIFVTDMDLVHTNEMDIIRTMLDMKEELIDEYYLNIFKDENKLFDIVMRRKVEDVFKWLSKDTTQVPNGLYAESMGNADVHITRFFARLLTRYGITKSSFGRLIISTNMQASNFPKLKKVILDMAPEKGRIEFVHNDNDTISKFMCDESVHIVMSNRTDLIDLNKDMMTKKNVMIPATGYNTQMLKRAGKNMVVTDLLLEKSAIAGLSLIQIEY